MFNPIATYRLQFHKDFTFDHFESIIPYLHKLGVSTVYASPIFEASPGSTHGYDGLNPHKINPEVGTEEGLRKLSGQLQQYKMGWLQDIVPNHMAFHPGNKWLMDVLEKGPQSLYAPFFDVAWSSLLYQGRIMVPFLGATIDEVIDNYELKIDYEDGGFVFKYFDTAYPLNPRSYNTLLEQEKGNDAIKQLRVQWAQIHQVEEPKAFAERWHEFKLQLAALMNDENTKGIIKSCLLQISQNKEMLHKIIDEQAYRLCHWQETDYQINFRRFFTVNGLICLNIQDKAVFDHYHQFIKKLTDDGIFQGLRIDHIDGLYDPTGYLEQLRAMAGEDTYIVVEKILEPGEDLPTKWPIEGNTGYDFLSMVNNLLTLNNSEKALTRFYHKLIGEKIKIHEELNDKKALILSEHMGGELNNLYHLFTESDLVNESELSNVDSENIKSAIGEFLIQCPVYRYYGNSFPLDKEESKNVQQIFNRMYKSKPELASAIKLLEATFLQKPLTENEGYKSRALHFYQRCMQFTGPIMAKGVEDTLMYTFNRFIGHNEVGDSPETFGETIKGFHDKMIDRQQHWPLTLNTTSTHDTKRGEGSRARLNALTELADEWIKTVQEWQKLNADISAENRPDIMDEYFIYQALISAYPMPGDDEADFESRFHEYIQKALREAKRHSTWTEPNEAYEGAAKSFASTLLNKERPFWQSFQKLHKKVADYGIINSLIQVMLKFTCPGVPDVYQGTELWDMSFVDPDNRRPVDYTQRMQWLEEIERQKDDPANLIEALWADRYSAKIKLWLVQNLFGARKEQQQLFAEGHYIPLKTIGKYKDHVLAFARHYGQSWIVVAVPLNLAKISEDQKVDVMQIDWKDTRIILPANAPDTWEHLLVKTKGTTDKVLSLKAIFKNAPLAILKGYPSIRDRNAGILLPITSLPSRFGVGDFGPEAKSFADFLSRSCQKYWQILPLNPTERGMGHSPYSSISSMAGNTLLISPDGLVKEGLLTEEDLQPYHLPSTDKADYEAAEKGKAELFEKAFAAFSTDGKEGLKAEFELFCEAEKSWLHDFSMYVVIKATHYQKAWFQWPDELKNRDANALQAFEADHLSKLNKVKWLQFIFSKQWKELKEYCHSLGIKFFGDIPFYVSHDSADVWANREIFCLDKEGAMTGVAGVPPDAFSSDGQLWGMPVFKWSVLKKQKYAWWLQRLRKNLELFDLVRLDHFRAFYDYWEVPAGAVTAKEGTWKLGPGSHFFNTVLTELGELPFIAEDLGEITEGVYGLRDEFMLPGMKVLQFAFGDDMPRSVHIPHNYSSNYIGYTGTHDNNTVKGWFRKDADEGVKNRLQAYVGETVSEKNVHLLLSRMCYASVAQTVILPIQDVLGLDEKGRINHPGSVGENWQWRLTRDKLTNAIEEQLRDWAKMYNRG